MKRFATVLVLLLMAAMPMMAERVTPETARKVAETFLNNNGAKSSQLTDLSKEAGFTNLYIFTTEQGFVVMAADDCVQPILGYSLTGKFVAEDMPENVSGWLQGYSDEIQYAIDKKNNASAEVAQQWRDLVAGKPEVAQAGVIGPLIQTNWDQIYPFNKFCPGGKATGCVATAMAQIMKYWNYPTTGFTSHSYTPTTHPEYGEQTAVFGETTYDWNNMILSYLNEYDETQGNAVATLMYHCGVSVDMNYGENGNQSGAITADVAHALTSYFNYSQTVQYIELADYVDQNGDPDLEQWESILRAELDAHRPVQYKGRKSSGGHSFICDGYNTDGKFHFNWGWSGNDDGWFTIMGISYSTNQAAIIGIKPIQSAAHAPTNLVSSVSGNNVTLVWAGDNAASYNIYRNHDSIGNTSVNTFIDRSLPVGDYLYYVRGVDTNGNVTLPTNAVTAQVKFNYSLENVTLNHMEASYQDGLVSLQWESPFRLNYLDYYTWNSGWYYTGANSESPFYWGARFLASMLDDGISLSSVATYFYTSGSYTAKVYQCTGAKPTGTPIRTITSSYEKGWTVIPIEPLIIDVSKDLWVVFSSTNIKYSTVVAQQSSENGNYCSYNGSTWYHFNTGYSFFVTAGLTIGDLSYTLYDNGQSIATGLNASACTSSSRNSSSTHLYTVKAFYNNEETRMSNMAGLALGSASLPSLELGENDKLTITENCQLTVSGTLTDTDPDNLILEDGAQLINGSEGVKATVKKTIQPYTEDKNDGWNLIASPITESLDAAEDVNGLIRETYDLYIFDQDGNDGKEWRNYEAQSFTTIDNKVGYLYSNGNETTISFAGTLAGIVTPTTITRNDNVEFKGFNLIGNPYPCEVYTSNPFYTLQYNAEDDKTSFVLGQNPIPPCTAILVQAQTAEESVSFSKTPLTKDASITMRLSKPNMRSTHHIDQARISFEAGCQLSKYTWGKATSTIYIPQNGQNFAVAYANGQNEMPLNFKAAKNGTYTLGFEVKDLELDYLHLIDNMTGADVDLLATPSYSFEGKANDYESRFKLVFSNYEDADDDNVHFAYYADGEIRLVETCHGASLQVVDMMGRVVLAGDAMNRVSTNGMTAGVYVLRLINGNDVKTQKIVIE